LKNSISKTPDAVPVWPCVRRFPMGIFYAFQSLLRQGVEQSYCHPTDHRRKALISMDFLPPKCVDSVSIDRTSFNNEVIFCFTIRSLKDLTSLFIILRKLHTNPKILWYDTFGGVLMQHILIVEDDLDIQDLLRNFLREAGYETTIASDGMEAIALFSATHFDLVLLDIMLPKIDGFTVCELIRKQSQVPIIMLTALNGEEEQIKGLDLQVDDYITKPFSMPILIRKIAAVLRRSTMIPDQEHQTISYKNLILDLDSYSASVNGESHELTQREFEVLRELLLNQGRVLTRQNLLDRLWKYDFLGDERVVDTHIKNLRKKLEIDFIQTIRGVGYKIDRES